MAPGNDLTPAGWYREPQNPSRERLWTGARWTERIRPVKDDRVDEVPVGWYADPETAGLERLWTGTMWTDERRPIAPEVASASIAEAPAAAEAPGPPPSTAVAPPHPPVALHGTVYRDARPQARLGTLHLIVAAAFALTILAAIAEGIADQHFIAVLGDLLGSSFLEAGHVDSATHAVNVTRWIFLAAEALTGIAFITWSFQAYRNLIRAGASDLRFGPSWAIWGWFVPFFNFVRPKQVINDTWKGSVAMGTIGLSRRWEVPLVEKINWWWATLIAGWICLAIGNGDLSRARGSNMTIEHGLHLERAAMWWSQVGLAILIAAALLAYLVVRDISRLQDAHLEAVEAGTVAPDAIKVCPDCAEPVRAEALVCRFCGHRFDQA
jgi:hypothetical protein